MRLIAADCAARYEGRLNAELDRRQRLITVKADQTVALHADSGAYKPLMWFTAPNHIHTETIDGDDIDTQGNHPHVPGWADADDTHAVWTITNPQGEQLTIVIFDIHTDINLELDIEPGLTRHDVEKDLQAKLAANPQVIEADLTLVHREWRTAVGPVDLLCRDTDGTAVAVEIKRVAELAAVEQLRRYVELLNDDPQLTPVRGILAAETIKPQTATYAAECGFECVEVDTSDLTGRDDHQPALFDTTG